LDIITCLYDFRVALHYNLLSIAYLKNIKPHLFKRNGVILKSHSNLVVWVVLLWEFFGNRPDHNWRSNELQEIDNFLLKSLTPCSLGVLSRSWIGLTMNRLCIVNPADIFVLVRQFSQPGASCDIFSGDRAYPDIINILAVANRYWVDPIQYIVSALFFPMFDVFIGRTRRKGIPQF
jgi:hypothetical protein